MISDLALEQSPLFQLPVDQALAFRLITKKRGGILGFILTADRTVFSCQAVPQGLKQAFAKSLIADARFLDLPNSLHLTEQFAFVTLPVDQLLFLRMQAEARRVEFSLRLRCKALQFGANFGVRPCG